MMGFSRFGRPDGSSLEAAASSEICIPCTASCRVFVPGNVVFEYPPEYVSLGSA